MGNNQWWTKRTKKEESTSLRISSRSCFDQTLPIDYSKENELLEPLETAIGQWTEKYDEDDKLAFYDSKKGPQRGDDSMPDLVVNPDLCLKQNSALIQRANKYFPSKHRKHFSTNFVRENPLQNKTVSRASNKAIKPIFEFTPDQISSMGQKKHSEKKKWKRFRKASKHSAALIGEMDSFSSALASQGWSKLPFQRQQTKSVGASESHNNSPGSLSSP